MGNRAALVLAAITLVLTSCASDSNVDTSSGITTASTSTDPTSTDPTSTDPTSNAGPAPTTVPEVSSTSPDQSEPNNQDTTPAASSSCIRLASFDTREGNDLWQVVNDDVMGGRSLGDLSFTDTSMVFAGAINTDGGGFSSLRLQLEPNLLAEATTIVFRAKADGRSYDVTFRDELEGRNRRVTHRTTLPFKSPGEWETVSIEIGDLYETIFGEPVEAEPFRPELASRIGIMISDGIHGPFELAIEWIEACT